MATTEVARTSAVRVDPVIEPDYCPGCGDWGCDCPTEVCVSCKAKLKTPSEIKDGFCLRCYDDANTNWDEE